MPFNQSISWSNDDMGATDKLQEMVDNDNYMFNIIPHFLYQQGAGPVDIDFSKNQSQVLKPTIYGGRIAFNIRGRHGQTRAIGFPPGTFAAGCRPVIMTQVAATGHERYMMSTIASLNNTIDVHNEGFRVQLYHRDGEKFQSNISLHFLAFGWQEA